MRSISKQVGPATKRILKLAGEESDIRRAVEIIVDSLLPVPYAPPTIFDPLFGPLRITGCKETDIPTNGELRRIGRNYEIHYSKQQTASRARFTIAHEIGHAILESTGPRCPQSGDEVERICDMLATCLLLPRKPVIQMAGPERSPQIILRIAETFDVSVLAAAFRFAVLFNTSVFEVNGTDVTWGRGIISKGFIPSDIRHAVTKALCGQDGEETVVLSDGRERLLKWTPLMNNKRVLFTASQVR